MTTKKNAVKPPLSMVEIVMRADVAIIEAALEARRKIDALLAERAAAYERIAALEKQVDEVIGAPDEFVFPPPPLPVAPFLAAAPSPASRPVVPAPEKSSDGPAAAHSVPAHLAGDGAPGRKSQSAKNSTTSN